MSRDLENFQAKQNAKKDKVGDNDIEIQNIRCNDKGIIFNIIHNEEEFKDFLIPSKYYSNYQSNYNIQTIKKDTVTTVFLKYFILFPLTILSIVLIVATVFKFIPSLQTLLNFEFYY